MSVEDFNQDWKVDWQKKIISCQTPTKGAVYTVTDFWRWARKEEASSTGMAYPHIVDTDGMGPSYDMPRKVKMTKGYSVNSKSLKFLTGDESTLLDQNNNVIVSDRLHKKHWWENNYIQGMLICIAIVGLLIAIISI